MNIKHRIDVAAGRKPADLLLTNARVVSVLADRILSTNVAIADGVIVGFGGYRSLRKIDLKGGYLSSGLIDSHIHIESTLLTPVEFARAVVPRGTTSIVADPHEIANVMGERGVRWMNAASHGLPLDIYLVLPSCVPESEFTTSGARLGARELRKLASLPRVIGLGEVMDDPDVIAGQRDLLEKIRLIPGMRVDGHAPGLSGKDLNAYIAAGIHSDHESTSAAEGQEKLLAGLHIMIREGTTEKNLSELAKMVTPANSHRCFFCSDDKSAHDLIRFGHIDDILRRAVASGIPPITALQMATNNAPYYFRLKRRKGAVAVGYVADLVVFDNLRNFRARMVFKGGRLVARDGELVVPCRSKIKPRTGNTMHVSGLSSDSFVLKTKSRRARAIRIVPGQIVTREDIASVKPRDGIVSADPARDILKLAVIERHKGSGRVGLALVRGFGLRRGALASTVCHDSHNLIVVGANDRDMLCAA
ncbi:MAG: adenine deaminase, partial [Pseudomonadota bacterium]